MRKSLMWIAILSLIVWTGCRADREIENENGAPTSVERDREAEKGVAELRRFGSAEDLEQYFKGQIQAHHGAYYGYRGGWDEADGAPDVEPQGGAAEDTDLGQAEPGLPGGEGESENVDQDAAAAPEVPDDQSHSTTTIQEEGVDEADVVKTDGTYLYVMTGEDLRIVRAVPADDLQELSRLTLNGWGRDLYLVGDLAVALTSTSAIFHPVDVAVAESGDSAEGSGSAGTEVEPETRQDVPGPDQDPDAPIPDEPLPDDEEPGLVPEPDFIPEPWYVPRPQTQVSIIDVSDRSAPTLISQTVFDGSTVSSRMIDGVLRLVLVNYPQDYYDILPLGTSDVDQQLEALDLDALLPDFQTTDAAGETTRGDVVGWAGFYRPTDPDGFGVSTVITLDTAAPDTFEALAVVAEPGLIYASTEALYITDTEYYYDFRRVDTDIYKFAFLEDTVALVGAGTVQGRILNQYSMGEYQGYLRVATTMDELFDWQTGQSLPSSNNVYVLGEAQGQLAIVGSVEGLAKGEDIRSARFIGPRGYLVTFEQMDPLFTLNLSDPENPQVVGEWHGPGYSTFIVPMDETHLLTVGVYVDLDAEWARNDGVQLSIFDVSNFAVPQQTHNVIIGDSGTSSEATWDPKAFTYFAAQGLVALPIEHWGWDEWDDWAVEEEPGEVEVAFAGSEETTETVAGSGPRQTPTPAADEIGQFQGLFVYAVSTQEGFDYLGRISTVLDEESHWWADFTRGVFIEDYVYAVTGRAVVSAALQDVDTVASAVELPRDDEPDEVVVSSDTVDDAGQSNGSAGDED